MFSVVSRICKKTTSTTTCHQITTRFIATSSSSSFFHHHPVPKFLNPSESRTTATSSIWVQRRYKWDGTTSDDRYDHIRADVKCPRCSALMSVVFSNRPLSITGREPGVYHALNLCPGCRTAFYFRPFKLAPLQGSFIEICRVKGSKDCDGSKEKECEAPQLNKREGPTLSYGNGGSGGGFYAESGDDNSGWSSLVKDLPTPKEIFKVMNEFVVGQEKAKKVRTLI